MGHKSNPLPPLDVLNSIFEIRDGELFTKVKWGRNRFPIGHKVGTLAKGYVLLKFEQKRYSAHRIIFYMTHGYCPEYIDHIDGNRSNNRIENLRPATQVQNLSNRTMSSNNTSGVKNVSWNKARKLWEAEIGYNHKRKKLGYFESLDLAEEFVDLARQLVHGDFANNGTHKGARYAAI